MSRTTAQLTLHPERCDQCGKCVAACSHHALKVGVSYIYVDWRACAGCYNCVKACDRGAIVKRDETRSPRPEKTSARPGNVVSIGSRAEAKAARKQAEVHARIAEKTEKRSARKERREGDCAARLDGVRADGMVAWNIGDAAIVLGALLVTFMAKDAILSSKTVALMPEGGQIIARTAVLGAFYAIQLWLLGYLAARHGAHLGGGFGLGRLGRSWSQRFTSGGLVVGLLVATRVVSTGYGALVQALGWLPPVRSDSDLTALFGSGGVGLALAVVMVAVVAPVAEELAFRGVILSAFGQRWGKWVAIVSSAALFAAYHFTLWLLVPTFVLGLALGWLTWERRSLWPAIILHALYNGTAVVAAFVVAGR